MTPLFSVIIPTRHRDVSLAACLARLAPGTQTVPAESYEVIVTDDGSATTAEPMLREQYPWVRWTAGPRRGPAANRNHGASQARGEWLVFTDDDCLPDTHWLAAFRDAIVLGVEVYEGRTVCRGGVRSPLDHSPVNPSGGCLWSCNMMIGRTLFDRAGGFDEAYPYPHMEDSDLRERLHGMGATMRFVENATIDHPPRPIPKAAQRAKYIESEVLYRAKHGRAQPSMALALYRITRDRYRAIKAHRLSCDSVRAACRIVIEVAVVARHYRTWVRRHAR